MARDDVLLVRSTSVAADDAIAAVLDGRAGAALAADEAELVPIVLAARAAGYAVVSHRVLEAASAMPRLAAGERRLLTLVGEGASNRELAEATGTSLASVKRDVARLADRLGVRGRPALIEAVHELGLRNGEGLPN